MRPAAELVATLADAAALCPYARAGPSDIKPGNILVDPAGQSLSRRIWSALAGRGSRPRPTPGGYAALHESDKPAGEGHRVDAAAIFTASARCFYELLEVDARSPATHRRNCWKHYHSGAQPPAPDRRSVPKELGADLPQGFVETRQRAVYHGARHGVDLRQFLGQRSRSQKSGVRSIRAIALGLGLVLVLSILGFGKSCSARQASGHDAVATTTLPPGESHKPIVPAVRSQRRQQALAIAQAPSTPPGPRNFKQRGHASRRAGRDDKPDRQ